MYRMSKVCRVAASLVLILLLLNVMPAALFDGMNQNSASEVVRINESNKINANDPHTAIAINGDANFSATVSAEDWTGTGSLKNPYIIENYDFDLGPSPTSSRCCIGLADALEYSQAWMTSMTHLEGHE